MTDFISHPDGTLEAVTPETLEERAERLEDDYALIYMGYINEVDPDIKEMLKRRLIELGDLITQDMTYAKAT